MTSRPCILLIGEGVSLAHIGRMLTLAAALDPGRYDIHFACDGKYEKLVTATPNLTFHALHTIPGAQWMEAMERKDATYTDADIAAYIEAELELFRRLKPAMIVADTRFSVSTTAEYLGIPHAPLVNGYWSPYAEHNIYEPIDQPLRLMARRAKQRLKAMGRALLGRPAPSDDLDTIAFNKARRKLGLKPVKDFYDLASRGTYTLYADAPGVFAMRPTPASHIHLGPVLWSPATPLPVWWETWDPAKPLIYMTLGTTGAADTVPRIVGALAELPVSVMVATAGRTEFGEVPDNVFVADYLPGLECASRASVVVSNGGSATSYQGLIHGAPVVGVWSNPDQELIMSQISRMGAALSLPAVDIDPQVIKEMTRRVLEEPSFRRAAGEIAEKFAAAKVEVEFNRFLDRALGAGRAAA